MQKWWYSGEFAPRHEWGQYYCDSIDLSAFAHQFDEKAVVNDVYSNVVLRMWKDDDTKAYSAA